MASTRGLRPPFKHAADLWVRALRRIDPRFVITSGLRSLQDQQDLWNRFQRGDQAGLFAPLPPGTSMHERGWAIDIARFGVDAHADLLLRAAGRRWRELGGVWGGESDPVHFEAPKAWTGRS